jgi:iron complex transport system substrate-binding protein
MAAGIGCRRYDASAREAHRIIQVSAPLAGNLDNGCPDHYDPALDYFPDKVSLRYSRQLRLTYHNNYKLVEFSPAVHTQETFRYVLVQCGTSAPVGYPDARVIEVPARRFILNDAAYGAAVVRLGLLDRMVGVSSFLGYSTPEIIARGRQGLIHEVGARGHSPIEPAIAIDPDLVFLFYSAYPNSNLHPKLWELGVQGVPMAGHFEPTQLGRSEWIKFLALFFNRERQAEELFAPAATRYEELARRAAGVRERPEVLLGYPSGRDTWMLNGGRNYMASFVWDAGGHYFWQDEQAGTLVSNDFERVYDLALDTGLWFGNYGINRVSRVRDLVRNDNRLAFFTPIERRNVFAGDRGLDKRGAYPHADQSVDKPDIVLADLIGALHPELLPGREAVFLRQLR